MIIFPLSSFKGFILTHVLNRSWNLYYSGILYSDIVLKLLFIVPLQECMEGRQAHLSVMIGDVKQEDKYMILFFRGEFVLRYINLGSQTIP